MQWALGDAEAADSIAGMSSIDHIPAFLQKIVAQDDLPAALSRLPRPWVFTNGVFDVLHRARRQPDRGIEYG